MAIRRDCPVCGRKNVEGRIATNKDDNTVIAVGTVAGGAIGSVFGPVGVAVCAGLANKAIKWFAESEQRTSDGRVWYRFNCPNGNCKHSWIDLVSE